MAEASSSSRLLGNSAWNAAAFVVGAGLNLLVLPFVVYRLGVAAFGMAGLVTACVAPALIFSNALALSAAREFAQRELLDALFAQCLFGAFEELSTQVAVVVGAVGTHSAISLAVCGH